MSSRPSYMHANINISVGPNWAPDGLAQMGSPLGTHLKTVAKVNWAPSGLPTWGPSDSPSGPHLWPSCTCWLGIINCQRHNFLQSTELFLAPLFIEIINKLRYLLKLLINGAIFSTSIL